MADGGGVIIHGRIIRGAEAHAMSLESALSAGHVVGRCSGRCGHVESVETALWAQSAADRPLPLYALARRLRCVCGAREVRLEVWPVSPPDEPREHRLYPWR